MLAIEGAGIVVMVIVSEDAFIIILTRVIPLLSHKGTTPFIIPHEEIAIFEILYDLSLSKNGNSFVDSVPLLVIS